MPIWFLNALMLAGLAAVAIPPIIHLLTRKRFDVVEWAAMQFLHVSERTRRKIFLEELLLMLLRMGLIALFVFVLAAPYISSRFFSRVGGRGNRDVVLIFDGSYSMDYVGQGKSAHGKAKEWASDFLASLAPGDSVAILQAKQQVIPVLATLTTDADQVRTAIQTMPPPRGGVDWPAAVQAGSQILEQGQRTQRDIIVLTDGQRFGWADDATLLRWELLSSRITGEGAFKPRIWVVNMDPNRPADPTNWSVLPIRTSRAITAVGSEVLFRTGLQLHGPEEAAMPEHVDIEVDGRPAGNIKLPGARLEKGQIPLSFKHRFTTTGSHLVTVRISDDALPGDNRQDLAIEVLPALPVLLIDGDERPNPKVRSTDFLRDALAPARDPNPSVKVRVMPFNAFDAVHLSHDLTDEAGTTPRVVIFCNVPRLNPSQEEGIEKFLADRGGVLVACGEATDAKSWNDMAFRSGQGWLPAQLIEPIGAEDDAAKAARPVAASFFHPSVELFRDMAFGGLADARFPRHWKVSTKGSNSSTAVAMFTGSEPMLIERPYHNGRVILSTVPLDNSWRTNLTDTPAFVPLVHELVYYLASSRSAEVNLMPGEPIRFRNGEESASAIVTIQPPDGDPKSVEARSWPFIYEETREPGPYALSSGGKTSYFVVQPDPRESQLAPTTEQDRKKVSDLIPNLTYTDNANDLTEALTKGSNNKELWLLVLVGVFAVLIGEIWMTRRMLRKSAA
jgi:VWA domain-containing protein/aerotolerance regulator-like protein